MHLLTLLPLLENGNPLLPFVLNQMLPLPENEKTVPFTGHFARDLSILNLFLDAFCHCQV
jgi:hypothetical protein